jgi:hypothetical protein
MSERNINLHIRLVTDKNLFSSDCYRHEKQHKKPYSSWQPYSSFTEETKHNNINSYLLMMMMMIMSMWWDVWTMTTNKPIVRSPGDTWAWRNMVEWWCWQGKTPDSSTRALWKSYQQRHLIASRRNRQKKWEFNRAKYFCSFLQVIFTCCKLLWHGASGITSPPKEGMLKIFSPLKIHRLGWVGTHNPWVQLKTSYPLHH